MIFPIILCGGIGKRLWPISYSIKPKAFLEYPNGKNLLEETIIRFSNKEIFQDPIIISNKNTLDLVIYSLQKLQIKNATIILEPIQKNTFPSILVVSIYMKLNNHTNSDMIITPIDHLVKETDFIEQAVLKSINLTFKNIITFSTKFSLERNNEITYLDIKQVQNNFGKISNVFRSDEVKLLQDCELENLYEHMGIYLARAENIIEQANLYSKNSISILNDALNNANFHKCNSFNIIEIGKEEFQKCEDSSIEDKIPLCNKDILSFIFDNLKWHDVGNFKSWCMTKSKDLNNNYKVGNFELNNCRNLYLESEIKEKIVCNNLQNQIIIARENEVIISSSQDNFKTSKPWGYFENMMKVCDYKIKKILILPNQRTSLQKHRHRDEIILILSGFGKVTVNDEEIYVKKSSTIKIQKNLIHRIENISNVHELVILEVQLGEILEESDITRIHDDYGRV